MTSQKETLRDLIETKCLKMGDFTLSNGMRSDFYFDCKAVTLDAEGLSWVSDLFLEEITKLYPWATAVGGLTMGADFIVAGVLVKAYEQGINLKSGCIVRKQAKAHGMFAQIENSQPQGAKIVVVDDVITTGASTLTACKAFIDAGYNVAGVIALVDRQEANGIENIQAKYPQVSAIFKANDFNKLIEYRNSLSAKTA